MARIPENLIDRAMQTDMLSILQYFNVAPDPNDRKRYKTLDKSNHIKIENDVWVDFNQPGRPGKKNAGGRGPISLFQHLAAVDFTTAVHDLAGTPLPHPSKEFLTQRKRAHDLNAPKFFPPRLNRSVLPAALDWLVSVRGIQPNFVNRMIAAGKIIPAQSKSLGPVICFPMTSPTGEIVGAEVILLTPPSGMKNKQVWGGAAAKSSGRFALESGKNGPNVLVESAVDGLSYFQMYESDRQFQVLSIAGRPSLPLAWVEPGRSLICATDADAAGDELYMKIAEHHPLRARETPPTGKDWNDHLKNQKIPMG
ncbi:toprim domain-containing protein [Gimibacter soli]|uniref:Toprim domain-containing protein n=1 Tax=Gimibacter soli TaxID=3024400 RepID=A0AAE9XT03_9PROT|nr:toprim domain-containing protein [Gimibacter soli]WCL54426.1 toprim domain-containing protein [Gimibacter soli]